MDPRQKASEILARLRQAITPAQPPIKEMSVEIVEPAGLSPFAMLSTEDIDAYRKSPEKYDMQMRMYELEEAKQQAKIALYQQRAQIQNASLRPMPSMYERHAIIEIRNEDGSNMLLDFDVQVHMEDGEFHSLIIAAADESVTILKDEFMRRLNEDDMLCKLIYKRIVKLKLLDKAPPPTAHPGSIIKQNGQVFMVAADGTLEPVNV